MYYIYTLSVKRKKHWRPSATQVWSSVHFGCQTWWTIYVAKSWHEVVIRNSSSPKSLVFVSHIISPLYSVTWLVKRFFVDDFWQEVRGEGQSKKALQRILCRPFALVWRKTPGTDKKSNPFQPIRKWHPEELVLGDVATIASVHVLQDSASEVSVRCNLGPRTAEFRARVTFQF